MQIDEQYMTWLSDLLVPDVFVSDYLPMLSGNAVKLYLYSLRVARKQKRLNEETLLAHLNLSKDEIKAALLELANTHVIHLLSSGEKYTLCDLKEQELRKRFDAKALPPTVTTKRLEKDSEKMAVVQQISDSFFMGMMGQRWFSFIDRCFHEYGFDPHVVYQLFADVSQNQKLGKIAYMEAVARNWHQEGITTLKDLTRYSKERDALQTLCKQVSRKLKRQLDESEEALVKKWGKDYGFSFKIISLALAKSVNKPGVGMVYFDRILTDWYKAGCRTLEEVQRADEAFKKKQELQGRQRQPKGSKGNFDERRYEDGDYDSLFEQV